MMVQINNILYPRIGARDDEVERLDGVELHAGHVVIDRVRYRLRRYKRVEYTTKYASQECSTVTNHWLKTPVEWE